MKATRTQMLVEETLFQRRGDIHMSTITRKAEKYPKCLEDGFVEIINVLLYAEGSFCRKVNLHSRKFWHSELHPIDQRTLNSYRYIHKMQDTNSFWVSRNIHCIPTFISLWHFQMNQNPSLPDKDYAIAGIGWQCSFEFSLAMEIEAPDSIDTGGRNERWPDDM